MKTIIKKFDRPAVQLLAAAIAASVVSLSVPSAEVFAGENRWGNPCDVRDVCSADPAKFAAYRENGMIKAREYVGEMRWGGGGAPDDVYVISKTVGSRDFANSTPCDMRDACINGKQTYQIVRSGPSATDVTTAAKADGVKVANDPSPK